MPGLVRHYYNNRFWPEKFESCHDEDVLKWLESHLCMIPMEPRRPGCSVVEGKDITETKVKKLAKAADECWKAILEKNFDAFASAFKASFVAQVAMFPAMIQGCVQNFIDRYSVLSEVHAWKMPGAGGGGYLVLVVDDVKAFQKKHSEVIELTIRRK